MAAPSLSAELLLQTTKAHSSHIVKVLPGRGDLSWGPFLQKWPAVGGGMALSSQSTSEPHQLAQALAGALST